MSEFTIDADLYRKDGLCAVACTRAVFQQERKNTIPVIDGLERCFGCGQYVSICPQGAISRSTFPESPVCPIIPEYVPSYDQ